MNTCKHIHVKWSSNMRIFTGGHHALCLDCGYVCRWGWRGYQWYKPAP